MNVQQAAEEALAFCESLSPDDRSNMLAIVNMERDAVIGMVKAAQAMGNADAMRFMRVAMFLHSVRCAYEALSDPL